MRRNHNPDSGQRQEKIMVEKVPRSPRLKQLSTDLARGDEAALDLFWREVEKKDAPLIEPDREKMVFSLVTFLWRAAIETKQVSNPKMRPGRTTLKMILIPSSGCPLRQSHSGRHRVMGLPEGRWNSTFSRVKSSTMSDESGSTIRRAAGQPVLLMVPFLFSTAVSSTSPFVCR